MTDSSPAAPKTEIPSEWTHTSLSLDEVRQLKALATYDAPYLERIGFGLAVRLLEIRQSLGEDRDVLREINIIEGVDSRSTTQSPKRFKHPPLHPLWHKHFSASRHLLRNMTLHWRLESGASHLTRMIKNVGEKHGDQPESGRKSWPTIFYSAALRIAALFQK